MAKTGHCVHVTTISQALDKSGLYGRMARRKALLKNAHLESRLRYPKKTVHILKPRGKTFHGMMKPRWNSLAEMQNVTFGANPTQHIIQNTIPTVKHGGGSIM